MSADAPSRDNCYWRRRYGGRHSFAVILAGAMTVAVSVAGAPRAVADLTDSLRYAVFQARSGSACPPLRSDPLADQTAALAAHSTATYLEHNARAVPMSDPLPTLKDLGLDVGKAKLLQGAGQTEADAIKAILVTGYKDLPDCSYTAYGISTLPNENSDGWFLTAVVLAGA